MIYLYIKVEQESVFWPLKFDWLSISANQNVWVILEAKLLHDLMLLFSLWYNGVFNDNDRRTWVFYYVFIMFSR